MSKARAMYGKVFDKVHFIECDLLEYLGNYPENERFDFVVHCASPTSGKFMSEYPVETYLMAIESTRLILEHAKKYSESVVYISSIEYYGQNYDNTIVTEDVQGYVDNTDSRSSYPLGKRAAEYLCVAYAKQFGIDVKIARLTQTFGAGVSVNDNRVFAQFARSVISGDDIVMHTNGDSAKPYCYTTDCVSAILYVLLKGNKGEAYNVANQDTYISIREMAEFLRDKFNPLVKVIINEHSEMGYAPMTKLHLSSEKLMALGWKPMYGLYDMYARLIEGMKLNY